MKWISIKDRLPDVDAPVLGCQKEDTDLWHYEIVSWSGKYWMSSHIVPSHWMQLPNDPEDTE